MINTKTFTEKVRALAPNAIVETYLYNRGHLFKKSVDEIDHVAISGFYHHEYRSRFDSFPQVNRTGLPSPVTYRLGFAYLFPEVLQTKQTSEIPSYVYLTGKQRLQIPLLESTKPPYLGCLENVYRGKMQMLSLQQFYEYGCLFIASADLVSKAFAIPIDMSRCLPPVEYLLPGMLNRLLYTQYLMTQSDPEWQKKHPLPFQALPFYLPLPKPWYPTSRQQRIIVQLSKFVFGAVASRYPILWEGDEYAGYFLSDTNILFLSETWQSSKNSHVLAIGYCQEMLEKEGYQRFTPKHSELLRQVHDILQWFNIKRAVFTPTTITSTSLMELVSFTERVSTFSKSV